MIPTLATFRRRDFSRSIFASQQFSDFVDQGKARCRQPAQLGWVLTQRNGDFRWTNPRFGREPTWTNAETVFQVNNNNRWPHGNVRWHCFIFCDTRRHCLWMTKLTERSWWDRNLQHALTESPTPVFATTSFTARMAAGWASIVQKTLDPRL